MRKLYLLLCFLVWTGIAGAQDTLYLKTGAKIPVKIVSRDKAEIKYQKAGSSSNAIYSVIISDVSSIHYLDGRKEDPQMSNGKAGEENPIFQHNAYYMKFNIGVGYNYFNRNTDDNLTEFWNFRNGTTGLSLEENKKSWTVNLGMYGPIDGQKRNWFGGSLVLSLTPLHTIYGAHTVNISPDSSVNNELQLQTFWYNIGMFYGHTVGHKKNVLLLLEPGLDMCTMFGTITLYGIDYKEFSMGDMGFHLAAGLDWNINRRLMFSLRLAERFLTVKETHEDASSSTGMKSFLDHFQGDPVKVKWSGPYVNAGIAFSLYKEIKTGSAARK